MSLLLWLPLNGNTNNQGLEDVTVTTSNTSWQSDGKIGQCLKLGTINSFTIPSMVGCKQMTFAYWIRVNTATSTNWLDSFTWYSTDGDTSYYSRQEFYTDSTYTSVWYKGGSMDAFTHNIVGEWNHYAFTIDYQKGEANFYVNGQKHGATRTNVDTTHYLNGHFNFGQNGLDISENDIRIYDTILSPKEISEIAKGLVLHYPLSMVGQDNLLVPQISDTKWTNWGSTEWTANNTREKIVGNDGKIWGHVIQNSASEYGGYACSPANNEIILDPSKRYTWSCIAKSGTKENAEIILWCHWRSSEGGGILSQGNKKFQLTSNPKRISWTLPIQTHETYTVDRINLMIGTRETGNNEIYFTDIKFEEGETSTPWIPNSSDPQYSALGFNDGIIYDVSGFRNNGEIIGDISYSIDTPRYNMCCEFESNNNHIKIANLYTTGFGDSYSFSWWGKVPNFNGMMWGFSNGIRLNGINKGNLWNTSDGTDNPIYKPGTTTQITAPSANVWHHFVMTGNGTKNYLYLDGELYGESKTYKSISGTTIYINGWANATHYAYTNDFYISDFRIYSTALSDSDVLKLYNTPTSLSRNGTLLTTEYVEGI